MLAPVREYGSSQPHFVPQLACTDYRAWKSHLAGIPSPCRGGQIVAVQYISGQYGVHAVLRGEETGLASWTESDPGEQVD